LTRVQMDAGLSDSCAKADDVGDTDGEAILAQAQHVKIIAANDARGVPSRGDFKAGQLRNVLGKEGFLNFASVLHFAVLQAELRGSEVDGVLQLEIFALQPLPGLVEDGGERGEDDDHQEGKFPTRSEEMDEGLRSRRGEPPHDDARKSVDDRRKQQESEQENDPVKGERALAIAAANAGKRRRNQIAETKGVEESGGGIDVFADGPEEGPDEETNAEIKGLLTKKAGEVGTIPHGVGSRGSAAFDEGIVNGG